MPSEGLLDLALERFEERLQGYAAGQDVISGRTVALNDTLTVPAKTPMVLELRSGSTGE
ncbi:MAG: cyclomaltodextrinase C-terminal domain-containing protein [Salinibacter sp.]